MSKITEIIGADGEKIYIQYDDESADELVAVSSPIENIQERSEKLKQAISSTVSSYSQLILKTVREGATALEPNKVTLQFGLQVGGETGIPFVSKGTAQANVTVTIEWELNQNKGG